MLPIKKIAPLLATVCFVTVIALAQEVIAPSAAPANTTSDKASASVNRSLPAGSKVFIAPMEGGFDTFLIAGLQQKKVPLIIVGDKSKADFVISGISDSERAGWAKMLFVGSQQSNEQASIKVENVKTGVVVYAYSVHKVNSYRGRQSAGEACAKHINEKVAGRDEGARIGG